jgi:hypothetical protein
MITLSVIRLPLYFIFKDLIKLFDVQFDSFPRVWRIVFASWKLYIFCLQASLVTFTIFNLVKHKAAIITQSLFFGQSCGFTWFTEDC